MTTDPEWDRPVQSGPPNDGPWWMFFPCLVAVFLIGTALVLVAKFLGLD